MNVEIGDYLNQSQAAAKLAVHRCTIWRWIQNGRIQPVVIGGMVMIPQTEVDRILQEEKDGAVGETRTAPA
jgi:excisionase family DNA binding protein